MEPWQNERCILLKPSAMKIHLKSLAYFLRAGLIMLLLAACSPVVQASATPLPPTARSLPASQTAVTISQCIPTFGDELSPSYRPNAPIRSVVGKGHILTGVVRSSEDCAPIPNVKLELWSEKSGAGHPDEYRATVFTDDSGAYRFECNPTDHIHMRISAEGYQEIASNAYHTEGRPEGNFDIVLQPKKP